MIPTGRQLARLLATALSCACIGGGATAIRTAVPVGDDGLDVRSSARVRTEHFVLELGDGCDLEPVDPASRRPIGVVAWRSDRFASGLQLECETTFLAGAGESADRRVLHVEQLGSNGPRLVWRELGAGSGRSLLAEWTADGLGLRTVEWSGEETLRETIDTGGGAVMPLYLVELVRNGQVTGGSHLRFDPLSRTLEAIDIRTSYETDRAELARHAGDQAALRTVELARPDGTLAMRLSFRGAELVGFRWQEGPLSARRIDPIEYERLLGRDAEVVAGEPRTRDP